VKIGPSIIFTRRSIGLKNDSFTENGRDKDKFNLSVVIPWIFDEYRSEICLKRKPKKDKFLSRICKEM